MNSTVNAERQLGKTGQSAGPGSGIGSLLVRKRGRDGGGGGVIQREDKCCQRQQREQRAARLLSA